MSLNKAASLSSHSDSAESDIVAHRREKMMKMPSKEIEDLELWKDPRAEKIISNLLTLLKKDEIDHSSDSSSSDEDERPVLRMFNPQELRAMMTRRLSSLSEASSSSDGGLRLQRQTRVISMDTSDSSDSERPSGIINYH